MVKLRKPIRKITTKQRARTKRLAEIADRRWNAGTVICHICGKRIWFRSDYVLDHKKPRKMGKSYYVPGTDDESNLKDAHFFCNYRKGSRRNFSLDS